MKAPAKAPIQIEAPERYKPEIAYTPPPPVVIKQPVANRVTEIIKPVSKPVQIEPPPVVVSPPVANRIPEPVKAPEPVIKVNTPPPVANIETAAAKSEDMTVFKKTILGKILGGAAKVMLPIAAAVTGVGAITGIAKGVGAVAGVKSAVTGVGGGIFKGLDVVATKAADLVTGMSKEQRKILKAEKQEQSDAKDKLDFANKLIKAGDDTASAYSKAGIPLEEASGAVVQSAGIGKVILIGAGILGAIALLAKLGKKR